MTACAPAFSRVLGRALLVVGLGVGIAGCKQPPAAPDINLQVLDLTVGTGATVIVGSLVTVNYSAWLYDALMPDNKGALVQTTIGGTPFQTYIGLQQVISGWDLGIPGMKVGGVRRLTIPPELAYGAVGAPGIPPNATLVYDITLLASQ